MGYGDDSEDAGSDTSVAAVSVGGVAMVGPVDTPVMLMLLTMMMVLVSMMEAAETRRSHRGGTGACRPCAVSGTADDGIAAAAADIAADTAAVVADAEDAKSSA
jgi:hypothetical protein